MTEIDQHQQFAAELGVWRQVLEHLPADKLHRLRHWLKQPNQIDLTVERPLLESSRAGLLADVCDRLVEEFGYPRDYLVAEGDALPSAPDDLSSMPDSKGHDAL